MIGFWIDAEDPLVRRFVESYARLERVLDQMTTDELDQVLAKLDATTDPEAALSILDTLPEKPRA